MPDSSAAFPGPEPASPAAALRSPTDEDLVELGHLIEASRLSANLSAREVADGVGISAAYLRILERGANPKTDRPSRPRAAVLLKLCEVLALDAANVLPRAGRAVPKDFEARARSTRAARGATSDLIQQIQLAAASMSHRGPFLAELMQRRLREVAADMKSMGQGVLRCRPDEEPRLTKLAVRDCKQHLRAVSYQNDGWWGGADGDRYLELHRGLLNDGVQMTRIFISDHPMDAFEQTLRRHQQLQIETYVLPISEVPEMLRQDFVVYDDALLRRALSEEFDIGKRAEFTDEQVDVMQALDDFNEILEIARSNPAYALDAFLAAMTSNS